MGLKKLNTQRGAAQVHPGLSSISICALIQRLAHCLAPFPSGEVAREGIIQNRVHVHMYVPQFDIRVLSSRVSVISHSSQGITKKKHIHCAMIDGQ